MQRGEPGGEVRYMSASNLPFTRDQFMAMFEAYNQAIWPVQVLAYLLGIMAVLLIVWRTGFSNRVVAAILAVFWLWLGAVFLWVFQRTIDTGQGPVVFAAAFIVQSGLLLWFGVLRRELVFGARPTGVSAVGWAFIVYAMVAYPLLGIVSGHIYPRQPMFGVAPCPTTIFTFGVLLLTAARVPKVLLVVPLVWSLISGISAPLNFGVYEDFGLLVAGIVGTALIIWRDRHPAAQPVLQPRPA